jgi:hypothetical protein
MSYSLYKTVSLGSSKAGLLTVGYRLYDADNTPNGARVASGIQDLAGGQYGALVTFPDSFSGRLTWDSGEGSPVYASEEINTPEAVDLSGLESAIADVEETVDLIKVKTDLLGVGSVKVSSPVASGGNATIVKGDDYLAADGRALEWTSADWPDLTGATVAMKYKRRRDVVSVAAEVVTPSGSEKKVRVELTRDVTSTLVAGESRTQPRALAFDLEAILADGSVVTLVQADLKVLPEQG